MGNSSLAVEKLVVARHGDYGSDGHLSERGRAATEMLAGHIRTFMGEKYVQHGVTLVLSSESARARETADIIASLLGLTCISSHALGDENGKAFM